MDKRNATAAEIAEYGQSVMDKIGTQRLYMVAELRQIIRTADLLLATLEGRNGTSDNWYVGRWVRELGHSADELDAMATNAGLVEIYQVSK